MTGPKPDKSSPATSSQASQKPGRTQPASEQASAPAPPASTPEKPPMQPDVLLLIGHGSSDATYQAETNELARLLSKRLRLPVRACFMERAEPTIENALAQCVTQGQQQIVALTLFLGGGVHHTTDVPAQLNRARQRWPALQIAYGAHIGPQPALVETLAERAEAALTSSTAQMGTAQTALLVVGHGSNEPDSNADVWKLARLLWEGRDYGWSEAAFYTLTMPDVRSGVARCVQLGAQRIVVLPYLLFASVVYKRLAGQAQLAQLEHMEVEVLVASYLGPHRGVLDALVQRYEEAVADTATRQFCEPCVHRQPFTGLPQPASKPDSAAAAPLQFDQAGAVAWDTVWTSFSELALMGGPPYLSSLLEPVPPEAIVANPQGYQRVLNELERGVRLVSGLSVRRTGAPGWIGIVCTSEAMALWLLRVLVAENLSARREGSVLYLPAGPGFRREHESKQVIGALAKAHHHWQNYAQSASPPR